jgi:hypothetical protein
MYAMKVVASTIFFLMMFPCQKNMMTLDQLMYYDVKCYHLKITHRDRQLITKRVIDTIQQSANPCH